MPMTETIKELRRRWREEKDQRTFACELLKIYDGDWSDVIYDALSKRFLPETLKGLKCEIDASFNLILKVVDLVAATYTRPAMRSVDDEEPEQYTRQGLIDDIFDVADKMVMLLRNVLLRPYPVKNGVDWDVITPDRFTVLPSHTKRGHVDAVMYHVPQARRYVVWTDHWHTVLMLDWDLDPMFGTVPNAYGRIPLLPIFESEPVRNWWQVYRSESLRQLALTAAMALSDLAYNIKMTSYKKIVIALEGNSKVDTPTKQLMDVAFPIQIKGKGSVSSVDFGGDYGALLDVILARAGASLSQWDLRSDLVRDGGLDATSAAQLKLQMAGLTRQHERRANRWKTRERRAYELAEHVIAIERTRTENAPLGLLPLPLGELTVMHADLGPPQDPKEELEYYAKAVDAGFVERVDAIMALNDLTREEAEEKMERIEAEKAARAPSIPNGPSGADPNPPNPAPEPPFGPVPVGGDV